MISLTDKLKVVGLSAAILLMLPVILWLAFGKAGWERKAHKAEAQVVTEHTERLKCEANARELADAINAQNAAVDQLKRDSDARAKAAEEGMRRAEAEARKYRDRAARIAARKAGPDQCLSARELIIDSLSEERK